MNELVVKSESGLRVFSEKEVNVIKTVIAPNLTDEELQLFVAVAQRTGLDPFNRQIYCVAKGEGKQRKFSMQATVDGFRIVAERSGKYRGQLGPYWCAEDGEWRDVWLDKRPPVAARIGILRSDFQEPLWAVARFESYAQRTFNGDLNHTWNKMPDLMIAKCAECLALRKAFPHDLSGIYAPEEMAQAGFDLQTEVTPIPVSDVINSMKRPEPVESYAHTEKSVHEINAELQMASEPPPDLSADEMSMAKDLARSKSWSGQRISVSNLVEGMEQVKKVKARAEKKAAEQTSDSPSANYKITFGKHTGKMLKEVPVSWLKFMIDEWYPGLAKPSASISEFYRVGCEFLNEKNGGAVLPPSQTTSDLQNDEIPF